MLIHKNNKNKIGYFLINKMYFYFFYFSINLC